MNDRFKFRVWTGAQMLDNVSTHNGSYVRADWTECENFTLMQCTGLKDKNGTLIYEGDILKIFHVSSTGQGRLDIRYVVYDEDKARFIFCENGYMSYITVDTDDICEVIGNIYENPEFLKEVSE